MINYDYLNSYVTYNLWFFNFLYLGVGIGIIINNYRIDKDIPTCDDIFTLICLMIGGNTIPVLTFSQIPELNMLTLLYSLGVASYAIPNYQNMSSECKNDFSKNYNNLWSIYFLGIILHLFNVLLYISKFYLARMICLMKNQSHGDGEDQNRRLLENNHRDVNGNRNNNLNTQILEENYQTTVAGTPENMYPYLNNIYEND